jgi:hypothetical protein
VAASIVLVIERTYIVWPPLSSDYCGVEQWSSSLGS